MNNEWLEVSYINFDKAILHGQIIKNGKETAVEILLNEDQKETLIYLNEAHSREMLQTLKTFVKD